jgi:hypothetical protein
MRRTAAIACASSSTSAACASLEKHRDYFKKIIAFCFSSSFFLLRNSTIFQSLNLFSSTPLRKRMQKCTICRSRTHKFNHCTHNALGRLLRTQRRAMLALQQRNQFVQTRLVGEFIAHPAIKPTHSHTLHMLIVVCICTSPLTVFVLRRRCRCWTRTRGWHWSWHWSW